MYTRAVRIENIEAKPLPKIHTPIIIRNVLRKQTAPTHVVESLDDDNTLEADISICCFAASKSYKYPAKKPEKKREPAGLAMM